MLSFFTNEYIFISLVAVILLKLRWVIESNFWSLSTLLRFMAPPIGKRLTSFRPLSLNFSSRVGLQEKNRIIRSRMGSSIRVRILGWIEWNTNIEHMINSHKVFANLQQCINAKSVSIGFCQRTKLLTVN